MIKLLRELLLMIAMLGMVSAGAVAQRKDQDKDKRPPKEPAKVTTTKDRRDQPPPRQNNNPPPPKRDKHDRPD